MQTEKHKGRTEGPIEISIQLLAVFCQIQTLFRFPMEANKIDMSHSFIVQIYFISVTFAVSTTIDKKLLSTYPGTVLAWPIGC